MKPEIERILIAYPRGFCAGVKAAIEILETELRYREMIGREDTVYGYHQIVHNKHVIDDFEKRGVRFIDNIKEVPYQSTVVFSAHGVSPEVRKKCEEKKIDVIDTTCPLVKRVHTEVRNKSSDGYSIVLIGEKGHEEIVGTMGEAPDKVHVIERIEDVQNLPEWKSDVAYVSQTTLNLDDCRGIIESLRSRYPFIEGPSEGDVCKATKKRQEAVKKLCQNYHPDKFLIFGSANSSNTRKLAEVAKSCGIDSYRLDDISKCEMELFDGKRTIGISSGASVPEEIVDQAKTLFTCIGYCIKEVRFAEEEVTFPIPKHVKERWSRKS